MTEQNTPFQASGAVITTSDTFIKEFGILCSRLLKAELSHNAAKHLAYAYSDAVKKALPTFYEDQHDHVKETTALTRVTLPRIGNLTVSYLPPRNYYDINTGALSTAKGRYALSLSPSNKLTALLNTPEETHGK